MSAVTVYCCAPAAAVLIDWMRAPEFMNVSVGAPCARYDVAVSRSPRASAPRYERTTDAARVSLEGAAVCWAGGAVCNGVAVCNGAAVCNGGAATGAAAADVVCTGGGFGVTDGRALATMAIVVGVAVACLARVVGVTEGTGEAIAVRNGVGDADDVGVSDGVAVGGGVTGSGVVSGEERAAIGGGVAGEAPREPPKKCANTPPSSKPAKTTTSTSGKSGRPPPPDSSSDRRRRGGSLTLMKGSASTVRQARCARWRAAHQSNRDAEQRRWLSPP